MESNVTKIKFWSEFGRNSGKREYTLSLIVWEVLKRGSWSVFVPTIRSAREWKNDITQAGAGKIHCEITVSRNTGADPSTRRRRNIIIECTRR